jgi:hypothetical protein
VSTLFSLTLGGVKEYAFWLGNNQKKVNFFKCYLDGMMGWQILLALDRRVGVATLSVGSAGLDFVRGAESGNWGKQGTSRGNRGGGHEDKYHLAQLIRRYVGASCWCWSRKIVRKEDD